MKWPKKSTVVMRREADQFGVYYPRYTIYGKNLKGRQPILPDRECTIIEHEENEDGTTVTRTYPADWIGDD